MYRTRASKQLFSSRLKLRNVTLGWDKGRRGTQSGQSRSSAGLPEVP